MSVCIGAPEATSPRPAEARAHLASRPTTGLTWATASGRARENREGNPDARAATRAHTAPTSKCPGSGRALIQTGNGLHRVFAPAAREGREDAAQWICEVDDVAVLMGKLRAAGRSAKTTANSLATLQSVLRIARRRGWILAVPVGGSGRRQPAEMEGMIPPSSVTSPADEPGDYQACPGSTFICQRIRSSTIQLLVYRVIVHSYAGPPNLSS
jgi:hypothetical protein